MRLIPSVHPSLLDPPPEPWLCCAPRVPGISIPTQFRCQLGQGDQLRVPGASCRRAGGQECRGRAAGLAPSWPGRDPVSGPKHSAPCLRFPTGWSSGLAPGKAMSAPSQRPPTERPVPPACPPEWPSPLPFQVDGKSRGRAAAHPGNLVGLRRTCCQQPGLGLPVHICCPQLPAGECLWDCLAGGLLLSRHVCSGLPRVQDGGPPLCSRHTFCETQHGHAQGQGQGYRWSPPLGLRMRGLFAAGLPRHAGHCRPEAQRGLKGKMVAWMPLWKGRRDGDGVYPRSGFMCVPYVEAQRRGSSLEIGDLGYSEPASPDPQPPPRKGGSECPHHTQPPAESELNPGEREHGPPVPSLLSLGLPDQGLHLTRACCCF